MISDEKKIINDLKTNDYNSINFINDSIIEDGFISSTDLIISNSEKIFSNMYNELFKIGEIINESYNNLHNNLFNKIRNIYLNNGKIDKNLIKQYMKLLKYFFPEILELLNSFNNIDGTDDFEYDKKIIEMINYNNKLPNTKNE